MNHEKHESHEEGMEQYFFRASAEDFKKIPGSPIVYWLSSKMLNSFSPRISLSKICDIREGINTGDNDQFLRRWAEIDWNHFSNPAELGEKRNLKWFINRKGGEFRKWYGNRDYVVNWECDGQDIHDFHSLPLDYNGAPEPKIEVERRP